VSLVNWFVSSCKTIFLKMCLCGLQVSRYGSWSSANQSMFILSLTGLQILQWNTIGWMGSVDFAWWVYVNFGFLRLLDKSRKRSSDQHSLRLRMQPFHNNRMTMVQLRAATVTMPNVPQTTGLVARRSENVARLDPPHWFACWRCLLSKWWTYRAWKICMTNRNLWVTASWSFGIPLSHWMLFGNRSISCLHC
jgi:hypothetical protein